MRYRQFYSYALSGRTRATARRCGRCEGPSHHVHSVFLFRSCLLAARTSTSPAREPRLTTATFHYKLILRCGESRMGLRGRGPGLAVRRAAAFSAASPSTPTQTITTPAMPRTRSNSSEASGTTRNNQAQVPCPPKSAASDVGGSNSRKRNAPDASAEI